MHPVAADAVPQREVAPAHVAKVPPHRLALRRAAPLDEDADAVSFLDRAHDHAGVVAHGGFAQADERLRLERPALVLAEVERVPPHVRQKQQRRRRPVPPLVRPTSYPFPQGVDRAPAAAAEAEDVEVLLLQLPAGERGVVVDEVLVLNGLFPNALGLDMPMLVSQSQ